MAQGHGMGEQRLSPAHSAGAPLGGVSERAASSWSSSLGLCSHFVKIHQGNWPQKRCQAGPFDHHNLSSSWGKGYLWIPRQV